MQSSPFLNIFRLCVQSVRPMLNISSLKESQFQALYSFICVEEVFVNLPTGSARIRPVANVPGQYFKWRYWSTCRCMRTYRRLISPLLAGYMHDQVKKLSSFGFKPTFVGPEQDPKILQSIERGNVTFVHFLQSLNLQRKSGEMHLKAKFVRKV